MRITQLIVHNFRGFAHVEIPLSECTAFVGPNDAGKSTILEAMRFLLSATDRGGKPWSYASMAHGSEAWQTSNRKSPEPVWVIGRFEDLTRRQRAIWGRLAPGGVLELGARLLPRSNEIPVHQFPGRFGTAVLISGPPDPSPEPEFGDFVQQPGDGRSWWLAKEALRTVHGERWGNYEFTQMARAMPIAVELPGPESPIPGIDELLRPLLRERLRRAPRRWRVNLDEVAARALLETNLVLTRIMPSIDDVIPGSWSLQAFYPDRPGAQELDGYETDGAGDILLSSPAYALQYRGNYLRVGGLDDDRGGGRRVGAGLARQLRLAVLSAYADPVLWPTDLPVLLLIEEPELGLHPGAQRAAADRIRALVGRNRQVVIVTHSTTVIDEIPPEAVRVVQVELTSLDPRKVSRTVVATPESWAVTRGLASPGDLVHDPIEVRDVSVRRWVSSDLSGLAGIMGVRPSDALIASRFLIVEGKSDEQVIRAWANALGIAVGRDVGVIPAEGYSPVELVAKALAVAQPTASVDVILDAGPDSSRQGARIARASQSRVRVSVLAERAIEGYFPPHVLERWLVRKRGDAEKVSDSIGRFVSGKEKIEKRLDALCGEILHRRYQKVTDGREIASLMTADEVPLEIRTVLEAVLGTRS